MKESELKGFQAIKAADNHATGFKFACKEGMYLYDYAITRLEKVSD